MGDNDDAVAMLQASNVVELAMESVIDANSSPEEAPGRMFPKDDRKKEHTGTSTKWSVFGRRRRGGKQGPQAPSGKVHKERERKEQEERGSKQSMEEKASKMKEEALKLKRDMENAFSKGKRNLKAYWGKAKKFAEEAK